MFEPNFVRRCLSRAVKDFRATIAEHVSGTILAVLVSLCGIPAMMLLNGASFWSEAGTIIAYGVVGPIVIGLIVFSYFLARTPGRIFAERTKELVELRQKLGMPYFDLYDSPRKRLRLVNVLFSLLYGVLFTLVLLIVTNYVMSGPRARYVRGQEAEKSLNAVCARLNPRPLECGPTNPPAAPRAPQSQSSTERRTPP